MFRQPPVGVERHAYHHDIGGRGSLDLRKETIDLTLTPQPKDKSPLVLRGPIYVGGTLANPAVRIDKGRIAARGLGAIALGLVNPLLAIIPLLETGPGKDSDCAQLIRGAQQAAQLPAGARARGSQQ